MGNKTNDTFFYKKKKQSQNKKIFILIAVIVFVVIGGIVALTVTEKNHQKQLEIEQARLEEQRIAEENNKKMQQYQWIMYSNTIPEGVTINEIDVSGLKKKEAIEKLQPLLDQHLLTGEIKCVYEDKSFVFNLSKILTDNDFDEIISKALKAAQSEDVDTALQNAENIKNNGYPLEITFLENDSAIDYFVEDIAAALNSQAKNAQIENIDKENHTVTTSGSKKGIAVDKDSLKNTIRQAIQDCNFNSITVPVTETTPAFADEDYKMIEISATTSFKGSSSDRKFNIRKGADIVNGTILSPGSVFSMNDTLGTRSTKNGWKDANAYVSGATEVQPGGGVCQLSSTLYNAVVKSDLKVVYRRNHSMPVHYIKMGLDATINSVGNLIDFKFENNTDSDLVIFSWTEGNNLTFKIVRVPFDTDEYDEIRLDSEKIEDLKPDGDTEIIIDDTLAPGEVVEEVSRRNGSIYQSYKNYYKNDKLVRSEKLALSTYSAFRGTIRMSSVVPEEPITSEDINNSNSEDDFIVIG